MAVASGTPRWAIWTAVAASLSVVPSGIWRMAAGFGVDVGMADGWYQAQDLPGSGTWYVSMLTVLTWAGAFGTLLLVHPLSDRLPRLLLAIPAVAVGLLVLVVCAMSTVEWHTIIGFAGQPDPGWGAVAIAAYAPAWLWGPCLLATTWAYWRRNSPTVCVDS